MKRILCFFFSIFITLSFLAFPALAKPDWPSDTGIQSEAGIVTDMDSGAVLFGQNIHKQMAPASITKLLTALVVVENSDLDALVTFSRDAMLRVDSDSGNKLDLAEGDVLSVRDCLYVMILQSSNQTSNALAEHVAGSIEAFADMMNEKAKSLGCQESNFVNPSGLHNDAHLTSAYDMAIISRAVFQNETLLEICSTKKATLPPTINNPEGRTYQIEHKLVNTEDETSENYYPEAIGGKTGYTLAAGQTLVTYARRGDRSEIAVTLKSTQKTHYSDTKTILDFGFDRFQNLNVSDNEIDYVIGNDPVDIGGKSYQPSDLSFDTAAVITLPKEANFTDAQKELVTELPQDHPAGAVAKLVYYYNERVIGDAWIYSAAQLAIDTAPEPEETLPEPPQPTENGDLAVPSGTQEPQNQESASGLPPIVIIIGIGAVLLVAVAAAFILLRKKEQRREEERRRLMRERRRQRLADIGYTEEDFERILNQRRQEHQE